MVLGKAAFSSMFRPSYAILVHNFGLNYRAFCQETQCQISRVENAKSLELELPEGLLKIQKEILVERDRRQ